MPIPDNVKNLVDEYLEEHKKETEGMSDVNEVFEAGMKISFDHAAKDLEENLPELRAALDDDIDAGSFYMGMQVMTLVMDRMSILEVLKDERVRTSMKDFLVKVRELSPSDKRT